MQDRLQEDSPLTNEDIFLLSTALEAKSECLIAMSEAFNSRNDVTGVVACMINTITHWGLPPDFPEGERIPGDTERDEIIDEARKRLSPIRERQGNISYANPGDSSPAPDDQSIAAAQLVAIALQGLSDAHAVDILAAVVKDESMSPALRWGALGMAQGITIEHTVVLSLSATESEEWELTGDTGKTALKAIRKLRDRTGGDPQQSVDRCAKDLCREYGIDEPSTTMLRRPGIISDAVLTRDQEQRYQLVTDIVPQPHDIIDAVIFNYAGRTYLKTIGEPFPKGFPHPTALEIAQEFLQRCSQPGGETEASELQKHRQTAMDAMKLAQLQLHCLTAEAASNFMLRLNDALPENSDMVNHVMRLITARDNSAQDLLLRGRLHTSPILDRNANTKFIKAARSAGLRPAALWEIAMFLNLNPQDYGISRPTLSPEALRELALAADEAGIPGHIVTMVSQETAED